MATNLHPDEAQLATCSTTYYSKVCYSARASGTVVHGAQGEAMKAAVGADAPTTKPKISANNKKITMYAPPWGPIPCTHAGHQDNMSTYEASPIKTSQ